MIRACIECPYIGPHPFSLEVEKGGKVKINGIIASKCKLICGYDRNLPILENPYETIPEECPMGYHENTKLFYKVIEGVYVSDYEFIPADARHYLVDEGKWHEIVGGMEYNSSRYNGWKNGKKYRITIEELP